MADYSLSELETLTGLAARTIRFYIQKGLVQAPFGARKTPRYTEKHVEQLLLVKQYKDAGLNLGRIAQLLNQTDIPTPQIDTGSISVISRIAIAPGVALDIDRGVCTLTDQQLRDLANHIIQSLTPMQGGSHD